MKIQHFRICFVFILFASFLRILSAVSCCPSKYFSIEVVFKCSLWKIFYVNFPWVSEIAFPDSYFSVIRLPSVWNIHPRHSGSCGIPAPLTARLIVMSLTFKTVYPDSTDLAWSSVFLKMQQWLSLWRPKINEKEL